MSPSFQWIDDFAQSMFTSWFVLFLAMLAASVLYRKAKGKTLRVYAPELALFEERWTSGRSLRNFWSRIGGAQNCLYVALSQDELMVRPHFPFSLLFLPEIYGLEVTVPRSGVRVDEVKSGILGNRVLLTVETSPGKRHQLELKLRAPVEFTRALNS
jgi:hypothetical protein